MAYVADLNRDFARFKADFDVVGRHLGNAQTKYAESERRSPASGDEARAGSGVGADRGRRDRAGRVPQGSRRRRMAAPAALRSQRRSYTRT